MVLLLGVLIVQLGRSSLAVEGRSLALVIVGKSSGSSEGRGLGGSSRVDHLGRAGGGSLVDLTLEARGVVLVVVAVEESSCSSSSSEACRSSSIGCRGLEV